MATMQRKKIIYVIRTLNLGGAERYLVESVMHINRTLFEPKIFCLAGSGPQQIPVEQQGIEVMAFQTPSTHLSLTQLPVWGGQKFWRLYRYLQCERPDIVHCYMFTPSIYGGIAAKFAGISTIMTSRMRLGIFKDSKPIFQILENAVNRYVTAVIANSYAVKEDVLRRERIRPEKVHVIYGGVDLSKYPFDNGDESLKVSRLREKHAMGIPEHAPVVGMIANLYAYKGYHEFIQAAAEVHRVFPEARFLCIGEDRGIQAELEQLAANSGLQQHIIFTGLIHNIADMFPVLDIQVSASYEEGFSSAILEGMASGKPIIATSVGGTPEAVQHQITGLLVSPKNPSALAQAIKELLAHPERSVEMGQQGRKRVETHFSVKKMTAELEALYLKYC